MNRFFEDLGRRFQLAAEERGARIAAPSLDPAEAAELLELARVSAHTQERRFAPLACFMAGIAAERLRAAGGAAGPEAVADLIRHVWREVEEEPAG